jgi:3-methyladenine DNA glycosylase/8-oxoguanine DNA glycosylase
MYYTEYTPLHEQLLQWVSLSSSIGGQHAAAAQQYEYQWWQTLADCTKLPNIVTTVTAVITVKQPQQPTTATEAPARPKAWQQKQHPIPQHTPSSTQQLPS